MISLKLTGLQLQALEEALLTALEVEDFDPSRPGSREQVDKHNARESALRKVRAELDKVESRATDQHRRLAFQGVE